MTHSSTAPRVFIAMATGILGGPGKGLAQFLRSGGSDGCYPLVIDYQIPGTPTETEYTRAMRAAGAHLAPLYQRRTLDYGLVQQALDLVQKHEINILQSHGYKSHVLCWLLHQKTGLPWVAFVHGWTRENLKVRLYHGIEQVMLLFPDVVVSVAESVRNRLLPSVRKRSLVVPNALAPEELRDDPARNIRAELGIAPEAIVAGVVGRFSPEKGQLVFVRALAKTRMQEPRLHGLLVGDGQDRPLLEAEIAALNLQGAVTFTGHVQGLAPYYRAMNMQVLPSFSEGMPNAALEGMYMGLPVLASNVGGVPEVVQHEKTGILLPAGDHCQLAEAMLSLASNQQKRRCLGEAGKARINAAFNPKVRAGKILDIYAKLLQ